MLTNELIRKSVHTGLALGLAIVAPILGVVGVVGVGVVLFGVFFYSRRRGLFVLFRQVDRVTYGELYFAAGIILSAVLFIPGDILAFQAGMLVLGLADPLATLVGKRFGRHQYRLWGDTLSYEGSAACFLASFLILYLCGLTLVPAVCGALILTAVEASAPRGSDNLLLPAIAGILTLVL